MSAAADILRQAAQANLEDSRREGNLIRLKGGLEMIVAGDIHGSRANLAKIIAHASLGANESRRLVLQEIIHGPLERGGQDRSIEPLMRAARLKTTYREQVLFLLGNHDLAQLTGNEIVKDGHGYCKTFVAGVKYAFGEDEAAAVLPAVEEFLASLPLAVQCDNGVLISHSVPSPGRMEAAGTDILRRPWTDDDLKRGGAVYEWTWGRGHTGEQLDALAGQLGVEFFVLGHQQAEEGLAVVAPRAVTVASDHAHGKILQFSTTEPLNAESVLAAARSIAALGA
jgi:hypothetical protein